MPSLRIPIQPIHHLPIRENITTCIDDDDGARLHKSKARVVYAFRLGTKNVPKAKDASVFIGLHDTTFEFPFEVHFGEFD